MSVRAKFKVFSVEHRIGGGQNVVLQAMYDQKLIEEDRSYAKATPSGRLEMYVDNPNVVFVPGDDYYLDFVPVNQEVVVKDG